MKAELESTPETLDTWHRRRGAQWRELDGQPLVAAYGEVKSELEVLRRGCGLIEQRWVEGFTLSGEDRRRFLNGYLTCDVAALETGGGAYGFFTSAQGRILADAVVTAQDESLNVEVARGRREPIIEHLSRYILADRVEIEPEASRVRWLLAGAGTDVVAERLAATPPDDRWATVSVEVGGSAAVLRRQRPLGVPVMSLGTAADAALAVADAVLAWDVQPVGFDALEVLRLEVGVPRYGADFDEAHFPQETGLEEAISYTKGCYLGQEVVARIHYRGHVNHALRRLRIEGDVTPGPGSVEFEGRDVGRLGSAAFSPALGETIALAVVHRKAAASGTRVTLPGGLEARVEEPRSGAEPVVGPVA